MSGQHRPEVGRTAGVASWSGGQPYCVLLCSNGHKKRTIDRIRWAGGNGRGQHLYTAGWRLEDPFGMDPGSSGEENPSNDDYKYRFQCPTCKINVVINGRTLEQLAEWVRDTRPKRLELTRLAAIVSG